MVGNVTMESPETLAMRDVPARAQLQTMCAEIVKRHFVMAELGSFHGVSTRIFSRFVERIYAVDPWSQSYCHSEDWDKGRRAGLPVATDHMETVESIFDRVAGGRANVVKTKGRHQDRVGDFEDGSLDMVYCDAMHSEEATLEAIDLWAPKVRPGGYIAGHDYFLHNLKVFGGVVAAVDARKNDSFRLWPGGNWAYHKP